MNTPTAVPKSDLLFKQKSAISSVDTTDDLEKYFSAISIQTLKECFLCNYCGVKGHWRDECPCQPVIQSQTSDGAQKPLTSRSDFKKSNTSNSSNTASKVSAAQVHFNEDTNEFPIDQLKNSNVILSAKGGIQTTSLNINSALSPDNAQEDTHNDWHAEQQNQLN
ncbi:hypothetical protein DFH28DRAFT_1176823 [Melampsora americana]|nr:hypothetical protein DFH28DRAFT_1176823 [Melampsora americana]